MQNMLYHTKNPDIVIRFAEQADTALILSFIQELADYEKMGDCVVATESILRDSLFRRKAAEVVFAELRGEPVGFALFFHNFSTFLGKPGVYLEDLYVRPQARGRGIGKLLLTFLAKLAKERDCGRLEWWCLDWNKSSIAFYRGLGATPMDEWTVYRVDGETLPELGDQF